VKTPPPQLTIQFAVINNTLIMPIIGYNFDLDRTKVPMYSILMYWSMLESRSRNVALYNMSGGVTKYKQMRGALPVVEYMAVYCEHLPIWQRFFWGLMSLVSRLAVKIIERKAQRGESSRF
jgi:hypothetical protein